MVAPHVSSFRLNLLSNTVILTFSESIVFATFDLTKLSLQAASASAASSRTLTDSTAALTSSTVITVSLSTADLFALQLDNHAG